MFGLERKWTEVMQEIQVDGTMLVLRRVTMTLRANRQTKACSSDCFLLLNLTESDPRVLLF